MVDCNNSGRSPFGGMVKVKGVNRKPKRWKDLDCNYCTPKSITIARKWPKLNWSKRSVEAREN